MFRKIDWESQLGRRLKLRDLHVFLAVVQRGSMSKAAEHLGVSQAARARQRTLDPHATGILELCERGRGFSRPRSGHAKGMSENLLHSPSYQLARLGPFHFGIPALVPASPFRAILVEALADRLARPAMAARHRYPEEPDIEPSRAVLHRARPCLRAYDGYGGIASEKVGLKPGSVAFGGSRLRPVRAAPPRQLPRRPHSAGATARAFSTPFTRMAITAVATTKPSAMTAVIASTSPKPPWPCRSAIIDTAAPDTTKVRK